MNKDKFNQSINNINVPIEKLMAREKMAIFQAKKKRKVRTSKRSILVACGLCITLLGSGFVSTGMAEALSNIPLIGPIYKDFRDIASDKIEHDQLTTVIDKQDSKNGLTMTVKEAAYDGSRLIVTLVYTGEKELSMKEENVGFNYITINGQPIKPAIGSTGQDDINSKTIIEHHQFTFSNYNEYGDKIEIAVHGEDLFGYEGELKVAFPLEKIKGDVFKFYPEVTTETVDEVYTLTADKVTFSPLSTRIDLTIDYPTEMDENDSWPWFDFSVVDDNGHVYDKLKLQAGMAGNYGHHMVLTLPPMDTIPKSLTLKPSHTNSEGFSEEIKELELVVPLNKSK
ncbi:DUF4179 domain-containing protein [Lysinibacillus fusiformis]|uniref:DUF4179 domain-containing protein n=1 Tax=Lysinibacillus fusiformis TaxID=28031 RepID=UPI0000F3624A|nr:DUF4179 domain-containing protein [Lysinibacillus fusiformis]EAZ85625.1 hypothetical protein BB14905_13195 [Bacillus sp. B14905]NOG26718.1 DUF4179 domain-containing protein [Lysinibacillus fusiformis]PCD82681.1 DUF4179 domain-containing protein [Lysinibacillus fusiformis]